jgi:hypothetical protein
MYMGLMMLSSRTTHGRAKVLELSDLKNEMAIENLKKTHHKVMIKSQKN